MKLAHHWNNTAGVRQARAPLLLQLLRRLGAAWTPFGHCGTPGDTARARQAHPLLLLLYHVAEESIACLKTREANPAYTAIESSQGPCS